MTMYAQYRLVIVVVVLSAALGAAQAQEAKAQARAGAVADGMSSVAGIAAGLNPLLPVVGVAVKAATLQHAESLPETERPRAYALAAASWQGSAAGNACAVVSVASGGSFLPACIAVGAAWGWKTWNASESERRDAERCAALRASARKQKLRCPVVRRRVERDVSPTPTFMAAQEFGTP